MARKSIFNERVKWFSGILTTFGVSTIIYAFLKPVFSETVEPDLLALMCGVSFLFAAFYLLGIIED